MPSYRVATTLYTGTEGSATFPEGKTWADVESWYVKWDILHVQFKGESAWVEMDLDSVVADVIDWKRPLSVSIYPEDEDGLPDYDLELDSE